MATLRVQCRSPILSAQGIVHRAEEARNSCCCSSSSNWQQHAVLPRIDGLASSSCGGSSSSRGVPGRLTCSWTPKNSGFFFHTRFLSPSSWSDSSRGQAPWSGLVAALQQPSSVEEASGSSDNSSSSSSGGTTTTTIVPSELSEQEEYAKEWAHKPRRIALFVEPSPFAYVSQQQLLPATP
jgi:hypothetical protein